MQMDPVSTRIVARLLRRLVENEWRLSSQEIRGKVTEVDPKKARARVQIGKDEDGNPVLSPWLPYKQQAGALKFHQPPTVGQTMSVRSSSGDIQQGVLEPFHWSDENQAPSEDGAVNVMTFGSVTATIAEDGITVEAGGVTLVLDGSGLRVTGGEIKHDGLNIGSTHVHGGVLPGGADTEGPH